MSKSAIDFERVLLLLEVIERTSQHGPGFNDLRGEATKELSNIMDDFKKNAGKVVTPPDGPANSAVANEDGTYTRIPSAPIRGPEETDEEWKARQEEHAKLVPNQLPLSEQPPTARSNERGVNETDAQFKDRQEQAQKEQAERNKNQEYDNKFKDEIKKPDPADNNLRRV